MAKKSNQEQVEDLVRAGILVRVDNHTLAYKRDFLEIVPVYAVKEEHVHDWRWNLNQHRTSDLWCVVDGCPNPFRSFPPIWGPNFPPQKLWPKYEGIVPDE